MVDYPIVLLKHSAKRDKTNVAKIEATYKTYMHTKTNRNTCRHTHKHPPTYTHMQTQKNKKKKTIKFM